MKTFSTRMARRVLTAIATTVVLSLVFWACQKDVSEPESNPSNARLGVTDKKNFSISVNDGILYFPTEKSFQEVITELGKSQLELKKWENKYPGFTSMKTAFERITESEKELISQKGLPEEMSGYVKIIGEGETREAIRPVSSGIVATLFNKDGLLQIGEYTYRFTYDNVYRIRTAMRKSGRLNFDEQTSGVQVARVINTFVRTGEAKKGNLRVADGPNENVCLGEYWHGNWICCKKRMVGEIQCQGVEPDYGVNVYLWFISVTLRTKHQRRYGGTTWWTTDTPELYLSGSGTLVFANSSLFPNTPFSVPQNYAAYNTGWLEYAIDVNSLGIPCLPGNTVCPGQFKVTQTSGYHTAVCNDWVSRSCSTWFDRPQ